MPRNQSADQCTSPSDPHRSKTSHMVADQRGSDLTASWLASAHGRGFHGSIGRLAVWRCRQHTGPVWETREWGFLPSTPHLPRAGTLFRIFYELLPCTANPICSQFRESGARLHCLPTSRLFYILPSRRVASTNPCRLCTFLTLYIGLCDHSPIHCCIPNCAFGLLLHDRILGC